MRLLYRTILKSLFLLLFPVVAIAGDQRFICSYKNIKGGANIVDIYFDIKNGTSRISSDLERESGDAVKMQDTIISTVRSRNSTYVYTVNRKTLDFKFDFISTLVNQKKVFTGICELHPRQTLSTSEQCESTSDFAESAMRGRQNGVAISKALAIVENIDYYERIVKEAYEHPRIHSEAAKKEMIEDFRDSWHLKCLKSTFSQ